MFTLNPVAMFLGRRREALTPEPISDASHEVAEFVDQSDARRLARRMRSLLS